MKTKRMIREFLKWVFKSEFKEFETNIKGMEESIESFKSYQRAIDNVLHNIDISVDVEEYSRHSKSWAVISLQGSKADYIKFIDLKDSDIREIQEFLRQFDRRVNAKIDASPNTSKFIKFSRY